MRSSIGCLVPSAPWSGRVIGVFSKAVSILHPDGALVSIVRSPNDMEARAMAPALGWSRFAAAAERLIDSAGAAWLRASWDGAALGLDGGVSLDFCAASIWDPRPRLAALRTVSGARRPASGAARVIDEVMRAAHDNGAPFEGIFGAGPFAAAFYRLRESEGFPAAIVGFGPGTTPSGDDWIAGYLCAADLMMGAEATLTLRSAVRASLERTTAAGRSLLIGAIEGAPPARLVELAMRAAEYAASGGSEEPGSTASAERALRNAAEACLRHGATSGEDTLAGFVAALTKSTERAGAIP